MKRRRISSASYYRILWSGLGESGSLDVRSEMRSLNQNYEIRRRRGLRKRGRVSKVEMAIPMALIYKLTLSRLPCPLFGIDIAVVTFDKC
jgi:hypothetical protein